MDLTIITPVHNDWESLLILLKNLSSELVSENYEHLHVIAVNDFSALPFSNDSEIPSNIKLTVLDLSINVGHQRAIIIGLCYAKEINVSSEHIIVMDADGEDNPADIPKLIECSKEENNTKIIFARREKRSEGIVFKLFYGIYKSIFKNLTGHVIRYGNFSCIPVSTLHMITSNSDFWNHYSGAILKSKVSYSSVATERGKRYQGKSKMNFGSLILHGLSSFSLYIDVIVVRVLQMSIFILFLVFISLGIITYIKLFTDLAIPGWASFLFASIINILITTFLITFLIILQHLNNRSQKPSFPIEFYRKLILNTKQHN